VEPELSESNFCDGHELINLLFHMTKLINRNSTKSYHAKKQPTVSGN